MGGYSFGGVVAFEMARQVQQAGQSVERLFLVDAYAPGAPVTRALSRWTEDGFLMQAVANLLGV